MQSDGDFVVPSKKKPMPLKEQLYVAKQTVRTLEIVMKREGKLYLHNMARLIKKEGRMHRKYVVAMRLLGESRQRTKELREKLRVTNNCLKSETRGLKNFKKAYNELDALYMEVTQK